MDTETDRGLTIKEAAARLGITDVAVRKRLVRGKLPGYKADSGQWFVHLSDDLPEVTPYKEPSTPLVSDLGSSQVIARLEDEVRYLRNELRQERESRSEELRRKDVLLAEFGHRLADITQRLPELPAPVSIASEPSVPPEKDRYPWWQFWKSS